MVNDAIQGGAAGPPWGCARRQVHFNADNMPQPPQGLPGPRSSGMSRATMWQAHARPCSGCWMVWKLSMKTLNCMVQDLQGQGMLHDLMGGRHASRPDGGRMFRGSTGWHYGETGQHCRETEKHRAALQGFWISWPYQPCTFPN